MKVAELLNEDWGSSDWYPIMQAMKKAYEEGDDLEDAAKDQAWSYYKDMGYDDPDDAAERIMNKFAQYRRSLKEGMWVIKNKDGKEKRFKDDKSQAAIDWKNSSSKKKEKDPLQTIFDRADKRKYSNAWWQKQDAHTLPWDRITYVDNLDDIIKGKIGMGRMPDDWTLGSHYKKDVDGTDVAGREVRLMYLITKDDDMGIDDNDGEGVEHSETIGITRDRKNPEKLVYDGFM